MIREATTKTCNTCGEDKPLEAFSRSKTHRLGRQPRCKDCTRAYQREWTKDPQNRARQAAAQRKSKRRHAEKHAARQCVVRAVRSGRLVRPDACEACGHPCKPDAHHSDYSKPRDVRWLCRSCHKLADQGLLAKPGCSHSGPLERPCWVFSGGGS